MGVKRNEKGYDAARNRDVQQAASPESQHLGDPGRPLRAISISLVLALLLLACKFVAYALTGSTAILSDALESVVNVVAAGFALFSVIVAARPADRGHPYGHGKVEYFSAAVEGGLILAVAGYIVVEAIRELTRGPELQLLGWGMALMAGTAAINTVLGVYLLRVGRRARSLTLEADGRHVLTDVVTTVGVVVGLLLVRITGVLALDPIVALLVAANIVRTGYGLMRRAVAGLMDEADPETLEGIRRSLLGHHDPAAIEIHQLRAWRSGRAVYADFHVLLPHWFDLQRAHDLGNALRDAALAPFGGIGDAVVHLDPCSEVYCAHCRLEACAVRQTPYREPLDQTIAAVTGEPLKLRAG